jgi:hypothetical protein
LIKSLLFKFIIADYMVSGSVGIMSLLNKDSNWL